MPSNASAAADGDEGSVAAFTLCAVGGRCASAQFRWRQAPASVIDERSASLSEPPDRLQIARRTRERRPRFEDRSLDASCDLLAHAVGIEVEKPGAGVVEESGEVLLLQDGACLAREPGGAFLRQRAGAVPRALAGDAEQPSPEMRGQGAVEALRKEDVRVGRGANELVDLGVVDAVVQRAQSGSIDRKNARRQPA